MRKGFTIVEVLVMVIVLPFMLIVLNDLFRTLIKDVPRSHQTVQENASLLSMLEQMQKDIDKAKGLPESFDEYTTGDKVLLIELAEGMICYQLKDEKVFRRKLPDNRQISALEQTAWSIPNAKVEWQVWRKDGDGPPAAGFDWNPALLGAVEVKTHIEHKIRGEHLEKKMANSHLYFVEAL